MSDNGTVQDWWKTFFDADYLRLWGKLFTPEQNAQQADAIWQLLRLQGGSPLLDAPCGDGRLSNEFAKRGAVVLGVDQAEALLTEAAWHNTYPDRLRFLHHDLREPLPEGGFDAACNVFSSIGYGTEDDDLAIFRTLHDAARPGGWSSLTRTTVTLPLHFYCEVRSQQIDFVMGHSSLKRSSSGSGSVRGDRPVLRRLRRTSWVRRARHSLPAMWASSLPLLRVCPRLSATAPDE